MLFLSSLDNFLWDVYIIFQEGVDNFKIQSTKHGTFWLGVWYLLNKTFRIAAVCQKRKIKWWRHQIRALKVKWYTATVGHFKC